MKGYLVVETIGYESGVDGMKSYIAPETFYIPDAVVKT